MKKFIFIFFIILIIIYYYFNYITLENFELSTKFVGPLLFFDYNKSLIGTYPDNNIYTDLFKKKNGKYINLIGSGKPIEIILPKPNIGYKGIKGDIGSPGNRGPIGFSGQGITGLRGPTGIRGPRGIKGNDATCDICKIGDRGDKGKKGYKGERGDKGDKGLTPTRAAAPIGPSGDKGEKGIPGMRSLDKGKKGDKGDIGIKGPIGAFHKITGPIGNSSESNINGNFSINDINGNSNQLIINNDNITINTKKIFVNNKLCIDDNIEGLICITKDHISKLNKVKNPKCYCNHGTEAKNDDCNFQGEKCVSCNDGRYLKNDIQDGLNRKRVSTKICSLCTENHNCAKGEYIEGCNNNNKGRCVKCLWCEKGYYRKDCSGIDPGYCTQYTNCTHGILQNGTPYSDNVCCKPNNCPANHFRASYSCQNGPTCQPYQHCPNGIRHHGTPTTNHVCKQLTHRSQQYGPSYERHLSSEYGNYKYAWILSWREGNWYSYVIWDNKVVLFKNHGGPFNNWPNIWHKTAHVWTSPISWGPRGQRIFKRHDHEHHGGDDFKCTLDKKLSTGNYQAGDPFKNNNGVCGKRGWSSNKTWYYSVWMRDIWTEYA